MTPADIDSLFSHALMGNYDDEAPWEAVHKLQLIGTREVFDKAANWCRSELTIHRARGADVLAQLGKTWEHRQNSYPEESFEVITRMLANEQETVPLGSAIFALGHLDDARAVSLIAPFRLHANAEVRFAVACALGSYPNDSLSASTLLILLEDKDDDVRDWATFGLGVLGDADSLLIREGLVRRLRDLNDDVREEAMVSLAKRKDRRVLPCLIKALDESTQSDRTIEAAFIMLDMQEERDDWNANDYANELRKRFGAAIG